MRLLLVEDNAALAASIRLYLERQAFVVDLADSLRVANLAVQQHQFDLILLDRRLPDGDGLSLISLCKRHNIKQRFIVASGVAELDEKILSYSKGILDYIVKPYEPAELLARIKVALNYPLQQPEQICSFGPLSQDKTSRNFMINGENLSLSRSEKLLLEALFLRAGNPVSKEQLGYRLYGYDNFINVNPLEAQVSRLRRLLANHSSQLKIVTIRNVGYSLIKTA